MDIKLQQRSEVRGNEFEIKFFIRMIPMPSLFDSRKQKKLLSPCHVTAWQSTRLKVLIVLAYFMPRFKEMEILFIAREAAQKM